MATSRSEALALAPDVAGAGARQAAVVDLGSNSWRLVVFEYVPGGPWRRTGQLSEPVRIAAGLAASGRLGRRAMARGLRTLEVFTRYCRGRGLAPDDIDAVATSAVRDATNGAEFLARAREATGLDVRVLSADEEARYGYLAAVNSTTLSDGAVLDLGGGSLQLVSVENRRAGDAGSWPLGAVRVTERLLPDRRPPTRKELKRARAAVRAELDGAEWLGETGHRLVGLGGAVRNLAAAAAADRKVDALGETGIQGFRLSARELRRLVTVLGGRPASRRALPGIKPSRADVILGAALVLEAVLDLGDFAEIEATRSGLREGVFFDTRLRAGAAPLIPDVRRAAVRGLAAHCRADLDHADHVARLALQLHDSLPAAAGVAPAVDERLLLWAAAILHDIGMSVAYAGHEEHAHYVIRNSGLDGFGPREVALIAQIVRYHRKGRPDLGTFRSLARPGDRELVARCALVLRLAEQLERGHDRAIERAWFEAQGGDMRLALRGPDGLARWSVERHVDLQAFRRVFGRRLLV